MARQSERVGRSGEYLVASVLSTLSDTVTVMPHGSKADIIFEVGQTLYKCQVKTQKQIEKARKSWRFDLRCGSHSKTRFYNKGDIDVYALVALNCQKVMFFFPDGSKQVSVEDKDIQAIDSLKNVENLFKELQCQQTQ
jgi:ribosomal protein L32E